MAELETLKDVERWLKEPGRRREEIIIFAARAVLRAVPALGRELRSSWGRQEMRAALVLPVFRSMAAPWVAARYPAPDAAFRAAADAAFAARGYAAAAGAGIAHAAADAARAATGDAAAASTAADLAKFAAGVATDSMATSAYGSEPLKPDPTVFVTDIEDANFLRDGMPPGILASLGLWHGHEPYWTGMLWSRLRKELHDADEGWDVWIDWYERRLAGASLGLPLERAWLDLTDDDWEQGPAHANRRLKKIIARRMPPPQQRPGVQWVEHGDKLVIASEADATDLAAAEKPLVRQLHAAVRQKVERLAPLLNSIDESLGWSGFDEAFDLFRAAVEGETAQVSERIGMLYSATISLGTFLEFDNELHQKPQDFKNVQPLDPDQRRAFMDLIRTAAPWVRQFPTAAALDDEAGKLLTKLASVEVAARLADRALQAVLITKEDHAHLHALLASGKLSGTPAEKARGRGVVSLRNLLSATCVVASLAGGALGPSVVDKSESLQAATTWIAENIDDLTALVSDLPEDIRLTMLDIIEDFRPKPGNGGKPPTDVAAIPPERRRKGK